MSEPNRIHAIEMILHILDIDCILTLKVDCIAIDINVSTSISVSIDIQTTKNVFHFIGRFAIQRIEACQLILAIRVCEWERKCIIEFRRYIGMRLV